VPVVMMGWGDVRYCFAMAILVIIILEVNICPLSLPHFPSIFFAYLWSFRWPNYIVTLPRYFSFRLPHLNITRDHQKQFWKGAIQGSFHQSLVAIGPLVSEKIFMWISHSPIGSYVKLSSAVGAILVDGVEPPDTFFYEIWTFADSDRLCKLEKEGGN
jgi:hypothetical protein